MIKCYELISVIVKGETVFARPVAWDREIYDGMGNDAKGEPAVPTEYHATCPHCGNLIHFLVDDMYVAISGKNNIRCGECGAASAPAESVETKVIQPVDMTYLDPIAEGLFDIEIDQELLEKLDSAEL